MRKFDWQSLLRFQGGALLMIVCGGILALCPDSASVLISAVLGWLIIAAGVAMVIAGAICHHMHITAAAKHLGIYIKTV